jgi:hypothetical protein
LGCFNPSQPIVNKALRAIYHLARLRFRPIRFRSSRSLYLSAQRLADPSGPCGPVRECGNRDLVVECAFFDVGLVRRYSHGNTFRKVGQLILRVAFFVAVAPHTWRSTTDCALLVGFVGVHLDWSEVIDLNEVTS